MHAIPLGRAGGRSPHRADHHKAAFGRLVAEAAFWSPAALLPSDMVSWEAIEPNHARATVRYQNLVQTVDIYILENGQPTQIIIPRWSDANPRISWVAKIISRFTLPMWKLSNSLIKKWCLKC